MMKLECLENQLVDEMNEGHPKSYILDVYSLLVDSGLYTVGDWSLENNVCSYLTKELDVYKHPNFYIGEIK